MTSGINSSNKAQLKQIEKIKIKVELPQVPLVDLYMRVDGVWIYKGKSCGICHILMNNPIVIEKHRYICKGRKFDDTDT